MLTPLVREEREMGSENRWKNTSVEGWVY